MLSDLAELDLVERGREGDGLLPLTVRLRLGHCQVSYQPF
jgi:hypothetical protein